jgi:two-component system sensor histidine kinase CpxA
VTIRTNIFGKVLAWFALTVVLSFAAFFLTTAWVVSRAPVRTPFQGRLISMQLESARQAYLQGGLLELSEELRQFQQQHPGQYNLLDRDGRDLLTGRDMADAVRAARSAEPPWRRKGASSPPSFWAMLSGPPALKASTPDGEFTLISKPRATLDPWRVLPYYLSVAFLVILFSYALAVHFARPIRELRSAVARFGEGDLDSRMHSRRGDELGDLARDFDSMADRIQKLLVAERRLLQDVSHELRSPLARLGFAVELARTSKDPAGAFERIKEELSRLTALVGELLQVTRVEGDPTARSRQPIRLDELARSIAADCAIEADARRCRIRLPATPNSSAAPSRMSPATRSGTRRMRQKWISNSCRTPPPRRSGFGIAAPASRKRCSATSSSRSSAWRVTGTGRAGVPAWAWPSPNARSAPTEAPSRPKTPALACE